MDPLSRPAEVIRVLVVDDSVVARRMVARAIEADAGLELAGVAPNGRVALDKLVMAKPHVIVLDLDMPVMDGFETLRALRSTSPEIPVIVFSHMTARGAAATFEAMALGAAGFTTKPTGQPGGADGDQVRDELLPLIKALAASPGPPARLRPRAPDSGSVAALHRPMTPHRAAALVVAVSTGGPNALATIVGALPADLGVPMLIVQHMPAVFTKQLAERLNRLGDVAVTEAADGEPVLPGRIYIAPGGRHMAVVRHGANVCISIQDGPPENSCRPSADVLFRSAVQVYGPALLGLVLTGMGRDGFRGAQAICAAGGAVLAQDQASAVVGSMPGAVADAGLAEVVPLDRMGAELARRLDRRVVA